MKKILVIDDSPTVRQQVGLALSQAGYQVVEAVDGLDAISKIDASVAMLICDVNMPRMNGLEMLEKLRTDARWKALPVVMLTTEGQPALIERAKKAGAKGWIIKPFKAELLVAAVQRSITQAAREIERLNAAARVLSINARIEASRWHGSSVFTTIASEMQQLSKAIAGANKTVCDLANAMENAVPQLVRQNQTLARVV